MQAETTTTVKKPKVAVLLYGYLRTYEDVAYSFMKHVADFHDADIFYFGPPETDKPATNHKGDADRFGHLKYNPKNDAELNKELSSEEKFRAIYGARLKGYTFHTESMDRFKADAAPLAHDQWLFKLDPMRVFSMTFNMTGAYNLMAAHEAQTGTKYDIVIMTRPDLAFYRPLMLNLHKNQLHIPDGEGVSPIDGHKPGGNAPAFFYKNILTGELVDTGHNFNDQILVALRDEARHMGTLYQAMKDYIPLRLSLTPESMFYFHFVTRCGLDIVRNYHWFYEIVRFGQQLVMNVTDLPLLDTFDRHHVIVQARARQARMKYFLKDAKRWLKYVYRRLRY